MATRTKQASSGGIAPVAVVAAVVVLVALLGWMAYANFAPHPSPYTPKPTAENEANNAWITQKAKESGGDISKLNDADRARLQQITRGFGAMALKTMLQNSR